MSEAVALAEEVLARPHDAVVDRPLRFGLIDALSIQNRGPELIEQTEAALRDTPDMPLADQAFLLLRGDWRLLVCSGRLRALGGGRGARGSRRRALTGWESLTRSERAVVELVAEGLTNREVGKRLFISPHTVHSHLRRSFQKLNVTTRAALAAKVSLAAKDHAIE